MEWPMKQLYKLLSLSFIDLHLLINSAFLLGVSGLGLRLFSLSTLRRLLISNHTTSEMNDWDGAAVHQVVWAVTVASRYIPGAKNCLRQALVTQALLGQYGYPSSLCIGVARDITGCLQAHAWVENRGKVVIGGLESRSRFALLLTLNT